MNKVNLEISEKIRDHLTKQKAVAGSYNDPEHPQGRKVCRYRMTDGRMCAVGAIIPDSHYSGAYEGCAVAYHDRLYHDLNELYPGVDRSMLIRWQTYHDGQQYEEWCEDVANAVSPVQFHESLINGN